MSGQCERRLTWGDLLLGLSPQWFRIPLSDEIVIVTGATGCGQTWQQVGLFRVAIVTCFDPH